MTIYKVVSVNGQQCMLLEAPVLDHARKCYVSKVRKRDDTEVEAFSVGKTGPFYFDLSTVRKFKLTGA